MAKKKNKNKQAVAPLEVKLSEVQQLFVELGVLTADKWTLTRTQNKLKELPDYVDDDSEVENDDLLNEILGAIEAGVEIVILEDDDDEPSAKKSKKSSKKASKKTPEPETDDDADDDDADDDDADDDDDVDDDDDDDDDVDDDDDDDDDADEPPVKKSSKKSSKKKYDDDDEPPAKPKRPRPTKAGGDGKPGVIASIVEFLQGASEKKPLTKKQIAAKLAKRFPDRDADKMATTVGIQVPRRLVSEKKLNVKSNDKGGFWIE